MKKRKQSQEISETSSKQRAGEIKGTKL